MRKTRTKELKYVSTHTFQWDPRVLPGYLRPNPPNSRKGNFQQSICVETFTPDNFLI